MTGEGSASMSGGEWAAVAGFIEAVVAAAFRMPRDALRGANRGRAEIAFARQVAMYLAHTHFGMPLARVGTAFGRDRTTAAHACHTVEERRDDPMVEDMLARLEAALDSWPAYAAMGDAA